MLPSPILQLVQNQDNSSCTIPAPIFQRWIPTNATRRRGQRGISSKPAHASGNAVRKNGHARNNVSHGKAKNKHASISDTICSAVIVTTGTSVPFLKSPFKHHRYGMNGLERITFTTRHTGMRLVVMLAMKTQLPRRSLHR